jgi:prevent-host-death family protein
MRSVTISTLKAQLSAHLQLVRNGEEVLVRDRNKPIARLIPYTCDDYTEQQQRLIAKGLLTPPKKKRGPNDRLPAPVGRPISKEIMDLVWRLERDGR